MTSGHTTRDAFRTVMQNLFLCLNSLEGSDIMAGLEEREGRLVTIPLEEISPEQLATCKLAAIDRQGYVEACAPLREALGEGRLTPTSPEVWRIVFAVRGFEVKGFKRRPTFSEVTDIVRRELKIIVATGADVEARRVTSAPTSPMIGIPGTTVQAAYRDIDLPTKNGKVIHDITPDDLPDHDRNGELLGQGRKEFLTTMHRMIGKLDPDWERARAEKERREAEMELLREAVA